MNTNIIKILGFTALIVAGSSCQNQEELNDLSFQKEFVVTTDMFRACVGNNDLKNFSLYINQTDNDYDYNVVMKRGEDGSWTAYSNDEQSKVVTMEWGDNFDVPVAAVFSNNEIIKDLTVKTDTIDLPSEQTVDDMKKYDVLTFTKRVSHAEKSNVLTVSLKHLLAKLIVTPDISGVSSMGYAVKSIVLKNIKNGYNWIPANGSSSLTAVGDGNQSINFLDNKDGSYECLCVPQSLNSAVKLTVTLAKDGDADLVQEEDFEVGSSIASGDYSTITGLKIKPNGKNVNSARSVLSGKLSISNASWTID